MGPDSASEMPGMMTAEQMNSWKTLGAQLLTACSCRR